MDDKKRAILVEAQQALLELGGTMTLEEIEEYYDTSSIVHHFKTGSELAWRMYRLGLAKPYNVS